MKKAEMEEMLKKMEGFSMTIHNDYEDNGKTVDEKIKDLIESVESILFRLGNDDIEWNEQTREVYQWICDSCIIALYEAGVIYCGYETNTGRSADYDIRSIYETKLCEDF